MARRNKVSWKPGAVFVVPLPDGTYALGQAIALMSPTIVYCALTDRRVSVLPGTPPALDAKDV